MRYFFIILLSTCSFYKINAQIFPREGSNLYYRIIGISFPGEADAAGYKIEIAKGFINAESAFEKNITISVSSQKNKKIVEVPSFGCQYTWRVVTTTNKKTKIKSALHHFNLNTAFFVNSSAVHLKILESAAKEYKDNYVFLDGSRALYDMNGKPVWLLPGSDMPMNKNAFPRDLRFSPQGTITFIVNYQPYEISYDGNIIWHYSGVGANKNLDTFHHEFKRLRNGNYMGMIFENIITWVPLYRDSIAKNAQDSARLYRQMKFNTLAEFDQNRNIVWKWNCYDYLKNSDLWAHKTKDDIFDLNDLHENSFYFDEQDKVIYLNFRNVNRIVKIKYPGGNVLNEYGPTYRPGAKDIYNDQFCGQHSCKLSKQGYLYLYNNNTCNSPDLPTIAMFEEPGTGNKNLKKIWEYQCTVDDPDSAEIKKSKFYSGGNVIELPDQSIFVSMGAPYPKVFIVNKDKKILWSAIPELYDSEKKKWHYPNELYRASIISRKDLEQLIWNSEKTTAL